MPRPDAFTFAGASNGEDGASNGEDGTSNGVRATTSSEKDAARCAPALTGGVGDAQIAFIALSDSRKHFAMYARDFFLCSCVTESTGIII